MGDGLTVSGGSGGTHAHVDDLDTLGALSLEVGGDLSAAALMLHGVLISPDVLASAALDPVGFAAFEGQLLVALDGPDGISARAAGYLSLGAALQASAAAYRAMDVLGQSFLDAVRFTEGLVPIPGLWLIDTLVTDPGLLVDIVKEGLWDPLFGDGSADLQKLLTDHPGVVDQLIGASPGFLSLLGIPAVTSEQAASWLGLLYPDTGGVLTDLGPETADAFYQKPGDPPRGDLERLMDSLAQRNDATDGAVGQIDVKAIPQADGTVKYIVTMPGTREWDATPFGDHPSANDLQTNLHAMAGDVTVYERMVAEALRAAGAPPGADVMLIGHSQGGIVAMNAAADSGTSDFPYTVTHVVTAGSPVANIEVPPTTQVMAFENANDIVPHLDGHPNEDSANITTVTFDHQTDTVLGNHALGSSNYGWAAQQADASNDPSIRSFVDSAAGYFSQTGQPTTQVYEVSR